METKTKEVAGKKQTLIEEDTEFKGSFNSTCPIVVKGRIEGDISGPSLTVSKSGAVSGTVKVDHIEADGELAGEYEADYVRLSGKVQDNTVIRARSIEVKLASEKGRMQVIFGESELDVGDMPSKEDAARAASSVEDAAQEPADPPATDEHPKQEAPPAEAGADDEATAGSKETSDAADEGADAAQQDNGAKAQGSGKAKRRSSTIPPLG